jgi:hypothetical protein
VASTAYVAIHRPVAIPDLVSLEVIEGLVSTIGMWSNIAVVWIET